MPRQHRFLRKDACYHVMNRGAGRQVIYRRPSDKQVFLEMLGESVEEHDVVCHAYCLMDNHFHLLIRTPRANLPDFMHHLCSRFSNYVNRRDGTDGPLFRGRYMDVLAEDGRYLLIVSRYIHMNPVSAGLVDDPQEFPWSSARAYLGLEAVPGWMDLSALEELLPIYGIKDFSTLLVDGVY